MRTDAPTGVDLPFPYGLERVAVIMRPEPDEPLEAEGVLNPAALRARDGSALLLPRLVAAGNRSRIGLAEILFTDGAPSGVQRRGVVLGPDRGWEHGIDHGGVEDPRTTWVPALDAYLMAYVAFGPLGPRGAVAISSDGARWRRLGPIQFRYEEHLDTDLNLYPNKDFAWFPEPVTGPDGRACLAMLHRPMWESPFFPPGGEGILPAGTGDPRATIWLSYVALDDAKADETALCRPYGHREIAACERDWEVLKIGGGTPPVRVPEGWLTFYHGVSGTMNDDPFTPQAGVYYSAGGLILDADDPSQVVARSAVPLLVPELGEEQVGTVANVVFPTGILEHEGTWFVFYGMADSCIGVARVVGPR